MIKKSFIRGVFGEPFIGKKRRIRLYKEIAVSLSSKYQVDYVTYVFGEDNEKRLNDMGIKTTLIDKKNWVWDRKTELYRHKLEFYKIGMEEFDEIVYLDWDVLQTKPLPVDYWENLHKKEKIQGNSYWKRPLSCYWKRNGAHQLLINAGILSLRDKDLSKLFIKKWEEMKIGNLLKTDQEKKFWQRWKVNDEVIIQYVIDHEYCLVGKDKKTYMGEWLNRFEPDDSVLINKRAFKKEINDRTCFKHFTVHYGAYRYACQVINNAVVDQLSQKKHNDSIVMKK